jgi:hypothetical protein
MKGAVAELTRTIEDLGIRAVKVTGDYADRDLDDEAMWTLFEVANHHKVPILVHPAARAFEDEPAHPWLIGADRFAPMRFLSSAIGFSMTYMHTITRLIFSGSMDKFPDLKFAFFEGGCGWVPFLRTQLDMETEHCSFSEWVKKIRQETGTQTERIFRPFFRVGNFLGTLPGGYGKAVEGSSHHHRVRLRSWRSHRHLAAQGDGPAQNSGTRSGRLGSYPWPERRCAV